MGMRCGMASVWERVWWGVAGVAFGGGLAASLRAKSWMAELEGFPWGVEELSEMKWAVERATWMVHRVWTWWWWWVGCWLLALMALVVAVTLWNRRARLEAAPPDAAAPDEECVVQTGNER